MSHRVYLLLDIMNGKYEEAAQALTALRGVKTDLLEGSHGLLVICEALNRQMLAELTIKAMAKVEQVTEDMRLLPALN